VLAPDTRAAVLARTAGLEQPGAKRVFVADDGRMYGVQLETLIATAVGELTLAGIDFQMIDLRSVHE